jgi:hypothetical protein
VQITCQFYYSRFIPALDARSNARCGSNAHRPSSSWPVLYPAPHETATRKDHRWDGIEGSIRGGPDCRAARKCGRCSSRRGGRHCLRSENSQSESPAAEITTKAPRRDALSFPGSTMDVHAINLAPGRPRDRPPLATRGTSFEGSMEIRGKVFSSVKNEVRVRFAPCGKNDGHEQEHVSARYPGTYKTATSRRAADVGPRDTWW